MAGVTGMRSFHRAERKRFPRPPAPEPEERDPADSPLMLTPGSRRLTHMLRARTRAILAAADSVALDRKRAA